MNYNQLHEADPYTYPPIGDMTEEEAMELARQLSGVTMQEPGVSRLVSVDLDAAVKMAAS